MPKEKENIKGKTNDESSGTTRAENSKKQAREDPNTPMDAPPNSRPKTISSGIGNHSPLASADDGAVCGVTEQVQDPTFAQGNLTLDDNGLTETGPQTFGGAGLGPSSFADGWQQYLATQNEFQAIMKQFMINSNNRFMAIEEQMSNLVPEIKKGFDTVDNRLDNDEVASQASFEEIYTLKNKVEQSEVEQRASEMKQQELEQNQVTIQQEINQTNQALNVEFESLRRERDTLQERVERLESKCDQLLDALMHMQVHPRTPRSSYPHINEDVEMSEVRPPPESEKMTPCFDGNNMEVSSFTYRCRRHLDDYALYYKNDPKAAVVWIEDHLTGDAKKWYNMDELLEQADNPDPERILQRLEKEYKVERNVEEVKTTLLKLKYQWGKAYEYLAEFNRLSRILRLPEET